MSFAPNDWGQFWTGNFMALCILGTIYVIQYWYQYWWPPKTLGDIVIEQIEKEKRK